MKLDQPPRTGSGTHIQGTRVLFDLPDLLQPNELAKLLEMGLTVFDSAGNSTARHAGRRLCDSHGKGYSRERQCYQCPIARREAISAGGVWMDCGPGVQQFVLPSWAQGKIIGLIGSQPVRSGGTDNERQQIRDLVEEEARCLTRQAGVRRRNRLIKAAVKTVGVSETQQDIRSALTGTAHELFPHIVRILFARSRGATIEVEQSTGDPLHTRLLRQGEGHVGLAIRRNESHYEPDLKKTDRWFRRDAAEDPPPRTVLTIPVDWTWDEPPGAIQVQSSQSKAFGKAERREFERLAKWAGTETVKLTLKKELRKAHLRQEASEGWRSSVTDLLMGREDDISAVLTTKRQIYRCFADELKLVSGEKCIASSIRVLNPLTSNLSYVVCVGKVWTDEARATLYKTTVVSAGGTALQQEAAVYIPDVSEESNYMKVLDQTVSLWAKRFVVRGVSRGVVSVDWSSKDACSVEMEKILHTLVTQFESVLNVIAAQEELLFRELEKTLSVSQPGRLNDMVRKLANVFNAQDCALFLDRYGRSELALVATTHEGNGDVGSVQYRFGEGITGWVAKHRVTISVQNATDPVELAQAGARHEVIDPIVHSRRYRDIGPGGPKFLESLAAPIVARGRAIGVIRLDAVYLSEFRYEDEVFLQEIADRLARELDRIWIEEDAGDKIRQLEDQAQRREAYLEAQEKAEDFKDAVRVDIEDAVLRSGADGAFLIIEDSTAGVHCLETLGVLKTLQGDKYDFPFTDGARYSENIWDADGWRAICEGLRRNFGTQVKELVQAGALLRLLEDTPGARATLGLCFRLPPDPRVFSQEKARDLAKRISAELKPALRLERIQRKLSHDLAATTKLRDAGLAYSAEGDKSAVARAVIESALDKTGMKFGTIRFYDLKRRKWGLIGTSKSLEDILPNEIDTNRRLERCRTSPTPVLLKLEAYDPMMIDCTLLPPGPRKSYLESLRSWIGVPLRLKDDFLGAIILASTENVEVDQEGLRHVDILAPYAAAAISSLLTREKQLELAEPFALIGTMMGGFLHTMRNKLTGAKGYWDNLQNMSGLPEPATERLGKLGAALSTISAICHDLVSFAATDRSTSQEEISLNDLLDRTWQDLAEHHTEGVELKRLYDDAQPFVRGNPAQLETAIAMLIQNSIEALPPVGGGGNRIVRLETKIWKGRVRLKVADSGCGMDQDTLRQAFRPFFTTKGDTGNGLGLAVVAGIARRHRARIKITTEKNWGTAVTLFFPSEESKRG